LVAFDGDALRRCQIAVAEKSVGVQIAVLEILVKCAVKFVAACFTRNRDDAARRAPVFGGRDTGDNFEFADRILRRRNGDSAEIADGVRYAVQQNIVG